MKVGVINSGLCNLGSVIRWLDSKFDDITIIEKKEKLNLFDLIIFPGVGSFDSVINFLNESDLFIEIKNYINSNGKFLGICLGFQILFQRSDEGSLSGLSFIKSDIEKINKNKNVLIPHVGFNEVNFQEKTIFHELNNNSFYFTHSYGFINNNVSSTLNHGYTNYGPLKFISFVQNKNVIACQFHPEKSSKAGVKFLNLLELWLKND